MGSGTHIQTLQKKKKKTRYAKTSKSSAIFSAAEVIDDLTFGMQVTGDGYETSAERNSRR